ncbi:MAG: DUF2948 family protein [Paracoccaceae bacterium]
MTAPASPDARFEDAPISDRPLRLKAEGADDLAVISSLLQDAVGKAGDVAWMPRKRRLVALVNRFRWENSTGAELEHRPFERVRSALTVESVLKVRARGLDPKRRDQVFELLAIVFEPADGCAGTLTLTLAGAAEIAVEVECLELTLADLTQPWAARAGRAPEHGD